MFAQAAARQEPGGGFHQLAEELLQNHRAFAAVAHAAQYAAEPLLRPTIPPYRVTSLCESDDAKSLLAYHRGIGIVRSISGIKKPMRLAPHRLVNFSSFYAGSQTPVWEPLAYKLQLAIPCEAGASNTGFPSRSLGTSQHLILIQINTCCG